MGNLRRVVGDLLFLKVGHGVEPTERAHDVFEFAEQVLQSFADLVNAAPFDPASATQTVVLSCNHYQRELLLPALFARLTAISPGLRLQVLTAADLGVSQLKQGVADLLICPEIGNRSNLFNCKLLDECYACVVWKGSKWAQTDLSLTAYVNAPMSRCVMGQGGNPAICANLRHRGWH